MLPSAPPLARPHRLRWRLAHEAGLAVLLVGELIYFAVVGTNFWSLSNGFEVLRVSVEIGLLALAMTPVIVSGGIDLFGRLADGALGGVVRQDVARDAGLPIPVAIGGTLLVGAVAGWLNGGLITC